MARKNTLLTQIAKNQSLAAAFTTSPTIVRYTDNVGIQINISTTNSTGTFQVQVSDEYAVNAETNLPINSATTPQWVTLDLSGTPVAQGSSEAISISLNQLPYSAVRVSYTPTVAGTGTCNIFLTTKQIGG